MKHERNALDAIRKHGGQVQSAGSDSVTFTIGGRFFRLTALDGPSCAEFGEAIRGLVGFAEGRPHQGVAIKAARDAYRLKVADAALWLWMNRAPSSDWTGFKAYPGHIIEMCNTCKRADAEKAARGPIELTVTHERNLRIEAQDFADKLQGVIRDAVSALDSLAENSHCRDSAEIARHHAGQLRAALGGTSIPEVSPVKPTAWRTDTPPYDVALLAETVDGKRYAAFYVEQPILDTKPHGLWFNQALRQMYSVKRWMEIPQ